jgi:hypothetical protein
MDFKIKTKPVELLDFEGVEFAKLSVSQARISEEQDLVTLENDARDANAAFAKAKGEDPLSSEEMKFMVFRETVYPKLAACSTLISGEMPSPEDAFAMPASNVNAWWNAAAELNPSWFKVFSDLEAKLADPKENEEKKKEGQKPPES